jgi:hypothetical protein
MVLKIVIICQIQIGSHFIFECTNPKIHAQITNRIANFQSLIFEHANKYKRGKTKAHKIADIKIHRFCAEDNIQK